MKYAESKQIMILLNKMSLTDVSIPIQTAIKILKNRQSLTDAIRPYADMENRIFNQYRNGKQQLTPDDSEWEECNAKTLEVLESDIPIAFEKIKLSELDGLNLPMSSITALFPMLEAEKEGDE